MISSQRNTNQRLYFFLLEEYFYTKKYYLYFQSSIDWAEDLHYQAVRRQCNPFWLHIWHVQTLTNHSLWCLYTQRGLPATGLTSLFGLCGAGSRKVVAQNSPLWAVSPLCCARHGPQQLWQKMVLPEGNGVWEKGRKECLQREGATEERDQKTLAETTQTYVEIFLQFCPKCSWLSWAAAQSFLSSSPALLSFTWAKKPFLHGRRLVGDPGS